MRSRRRPRSGHGAASAPERPSGRQQGARQEQDGSDQIIAALPPLSEGTWSAGWASPSPPPRAQQVTGSMPVDGNTQPYGLLHGGRLLRAGRDPRLAGRRAARRPGAVRGRHRDQRDAPPRGGRRHVTGVATRLHGGRTITSYEIAISDEPGRGSARPGSPACSATGSRPGRDPRRPDRARPAAADQARRGTCRHNQGKPHVTGRCITNRPGNDGPFARRGTPRYRGGARARGAE